MRSELVAIVLCAALPTACAGSLPGPETEPQSERAYQVVPYPPPSALVEIVPPAPEQDARWIDGYWAWRGRYYVWERGGWVLPPDGAYVSTWSARYLADGTLLYAPTQWHDENGRPIDAPEFLLPAATPPTEETAEPSTIP